MSVGLFWFLNIESRFNQRAEHAYPSRDRYQKQLYLESPFIWFYSIENEIVLNRNVCKNRISKIPLNIFLKFSLGPIKRP